MFTPVKRNNAVVTADPFAHIFESFFGDATRCREPEYKLATRFEIAERDDAYSIAAELPDEYSICVELGGGTGSLTSALLSAGVPRDKLIVIERDPRLVAHLRKRFSKVTIVEGDAQHLRRILAEAGIDHVDAVISGLPLRNLPGAVRRNIATEVFSALGFGGVFVQFTYWGKPPVPGEVASRYGVGSEKTRRVWRNMPPANVWRYQRQANPG